MKKIVKLCIALSLIFTTLAISNVPTAEAATTSTCTKEAAAAEKALASYQKQAYKSLGQAIKIEGLIKGPITYLKQMKELAKLTKKVKDLTNKSFASIDCVLQPY